MLQGLRTYRAVARVLHGEQTPRAVSLRALFTIRSLLASPESDTWYAELSREPLARAAAVNPSLYRKIVRPYLTSHTTDEEKLRILLAHRAMLSEVLVPHAIARAYSSEGIPLARLHAKNGDEVELRLASDGKYRKEGEHSLMLLGAATGLRLSTLTFVGDTPGGRRTLLVGGAQGLPRGVPKSVISDVTKGLFGMRPKALLLFALRQLAIEWHVGAIRAVGNDIHVSRHHDYALNRSRRPRLGYDEFWIESGGVMSTDGFIDLPLAQPLRNDEAIPTGKRAIYRRRYVMLDQFVADMRRTLASLQPA